MTPDTPLVVVIAGPNGAGKSTAASHLLRGALAVHEFVNADTIAQGLSAFAPEQVAVAAGRIMLARLETLAAQRTSFAFETTLASHSFAPWLRTLQGSGYRVHLAFLSLPSAELALSRVRLRVGFGGHDVPEATIRRRYVGGLRNFFSVYQHIAEVWQIFDNENVPRLIATGGAGASPVIHDQGAWGRLREQAQ